MKSERGKGHRIEQVESTLRRAVQQVLAKGLSDPRYRGLVSVTGMSVTRDLREATVLVSVYPEQHQELTMHAISHAARHIRREVGELVALDRVPELRFKLDTSLKAQAEVLDALAKVRAEADKQEGPEGPDEQDGTAQSANTP